MKVNVTLSLTPSFIFALFSIHFLCIDSGAEVVSVKSWTFVQDYF